MNSLFLRTYSLVELFKASFSVLVSQKSISRKITYHLNFSNNLLGTISKNV